MPGPGSYGYSGKWVHDRAKKIMADGDVPKHLAYAIATQQGHKVDKSSKKHRTSEGVMVAKQKYTAPASEYQKTAMLSAFFDEIDQIEKEAAMGFLGRKIIAPLAIAGSLAGGGAKLVKNFASKAAVKAPTAITQTMERASPRTLGVGGFGGRSRAAQEVQEFMP